MQWFRQPAVMKSTGQPPAHVNVNQQAIALLTLMRPHTSALGCPATRTSTHARANTFALCTFETHSHNCQLGSRLQELNAGVPARKSAERCYSGNAQPFQSIRHINKGRGDTHPPLCGAKATQHKEETSFDIPFFKSPQFASFFVRDVFIFFSAQSQSTSVCTQHQRTTTPW